MIWAAATLTYAFGGVMFVCICQTFKVPYTVMMLDKWYEYKTPSDLERGVAAVFWMPLAIFWVIYLVIGKPLGFIFWLLGKAISAICKG